MLVCEVDFSGPAEAPLGIKTRKDSVRLAAFDEPDDVLFVSGSALNVALRGCGTAGG
jgi:hypothetical protein